MGFWGAGATAALGIRTTAGQEQFIRFLTGVENPKVPLTKRVAKALGTKAIKPWSSALFDLITILGDTKGASNSITDVTDRQLKAMRRNWKKGTSDEELRGRVVDLRLIYDWPALKSAVSVCPGSRTDKFKLNDLFNLLDMHIPGSGFRAPAFSTPSGSKRLSEEKFLDTRRLIGAKNALLMILIASFYIDYQVCIASNQPVLEQYLDFAQALGQRMQLEGLALFKKNLAPDQPSFYQGEVAFVSLNYDPIALWVQFLANRELNQSPAVPRIGNPPLPVHLFHDFGHLIPARRISKGADDWPWYPLNEGAAQRLNELEKATPRSD